MLHSLHTHAGRTLTVPPAPGVVLLFRPSVTARPAPSSAREGLPDSGAPPSMREGLLDSGGPPSSAPHAPAPGPAPASDGIQCSCASEGVAGGSSRLAARMSSASAAVPLVSEASSDSTRRHVCGDGPQGNSGTGGLVRRSRALSVRLVLPSPARSSSPVPYQTAPQSPPCDLLLKLLEQRAA